MATRKPIVLIGGALQEMPAADTVAATDGGTGQTTYTVGDFLYCAATNTLSKLAGNTTTTRKFLRQTGSGSVSAAPAWDTLTNADVGATSANTANAIMSRDADGDFSASIANVNEVAIAASGAALTKYTSTTRPDISGLTGGSANGGVIWSQANAHLVIALDGNDDGDSFAITSYTAGTDTTARKTQDRLLFQIKRDGAASFYATPTFPTRSAGDNSTYGATTAYVEGSAAASFPLMDVGGMSLNGTTQYLDTTTLPGIADGKKGSFFAVVRFANVAGASPEIIFDNLNGRCRVLRLATTGNLQVVLRNAANTVICQQTLANMAAAGTYVIMASWDMAVPGSMRMYINDVTGAIGSTTFTDGSIDYTSGEFSVGGSATGTFPVTGDLYSVWFDPTRYIDFSTESERRKFTTPGGVMKFLGKAGELPAGSAPIVFLGYNSGSAFATNRGTSTSFTANGSPTAPTVTLSGQYGLTEVDNTSDAAKPVSTAQQAALDTKASLAGTNQFTGTALFGSPAAYSSGSVTAKLQMHGDGAAAQGFSMFGWANSATFNPRIEFAKSRNGTVGAHTGGAMQSGDTLGLINFNGSDGAGFFTAAQITAVAAGAASTGVVPGKINFSTALAGSPSIRMSISSTEITPGADNTQTLGTAPLGWKELFCDNGTINTSDGRLKTAVRPFTSAEISAAKQIGKEIGFYQFLSAVAEKGDAAREHTGMTVQRAIAIMEENGLQPFGYGFICYDAWEELPEIVETWPALPRVVDDFGTLVQEEREAGSVIVQEHRPAGDKYSFRYDQLTLFVARGLEARIAALEAAL